MSRSVRVGLLILLPLLFVLLAAPSCAPLKSLASKTGRSVDDLAPRVDDAAQRSGQNTETLAERLAGSELAGQIIENAPEPVVKVACAQLTGKAAANAEMPGSRDWLQAMSAAQNRGEPIEEACEIAEGIAGAL